jgi:hypothetical protein
MKLATQSKSDVAIVVNLDELDDASAARPRGLPAAAGSDPVGGFMPRQYVADFGCAAARVAHHGEPFERKGRTGAIPSPAVASVTASASARR